MKAKSQDVVSSRWPMVRLGEVCEVVLGGTPKTGVAEYWNGDIPWLTPGDMGKLKGLYVETSSRKITQKGRAAGSTLFPPNSVILSTRAPIGYVFVNRVSMSTNQGCKTLVPNDKLLPEYLAYNLLGRNEELNKLGTGTTFKELATGVLKTLTIPLPPLAEQKRIVAKLEKELARVEAMKAKFERMATAAEDFFKATLAEEFEGLENGTDGTDGTTGTNGTNETDGTNGALGRTVSDVAVADVSDVAVVPSHAARRVRLGEVCENLDSKRVPITKSDRKPGRFPYYGASGIVDYVDDYLFDGEYLLVSEDGANLLARSTPIAFSVSGKIWVNNHAHVLQFADSVSQTFVEFYFASIDISRLVRGAAQPKLTQAALNEISLPFPPLPVQRSIISRLDAAKARCEGIAAKAREAVATCEKLRKALLAEAFR